MIEVDSKQAGEGLVQRHVREADQRPVAPRGIGEIDLKQGHDWSDTHLLQVQRRGMGSGQQKPARRFARVS
ncbi:hypothetical protein HZB60_11480 [candidate division KSB1 bacterium]|nr:hypothetical protein [candidate division KSB1 bacterium]